MHNALYVDVILNEFTDAVKIVRLNSQQIIA